MVQVDRGYNNFVKTQTYDSNSVPVHQMWNNLTLEEKQKYDEFEGEEVKQTNNILTIEEIKDKDKDISLRRMD